MHNLSIFEDENNKLEISYAFEASPFGTCLIGTTLNKVCYLSFVTSSKEESLDEMKLVWAGAEFNESTNSMQELVEKIFSNKDAVDLLVKGTPFQVKVWKELLEIPYGSLLCYQQVAERMNNPKGFRAVATAIANNKIAYAIPCHRVISKTGKYHQYRWGSERKKLIIGQELTV